jgi:hypothetical protein
MSKINAEIKEAIKKIDKETLEKLVLKAAAKDSVFCNFLIVNFVDKEFGE